MAFFNTPTAALLLSLFFVFSSAATAYPTIAQVSGAATGYSTISQVPAPSPDAVSPRPVADDDEFPSDILNTYMVPLEEQATDKQYLKAHMTSAANKVELFLSNEVERRLSDPAVSESEKECLSVCKEVYESAVDAMKTGMESINSGDFMKANFDVSAFTTNIDTCDECFDEFKDFDGWAKGVGGDCLDKIVKYSN